jgi:hypothetical protein
MYVDVKEDINLALQRVDKDTWRPIYQIKQRWLKNNRHLGAVQYVSLLSFSLPLVRYRPLQYMLTKFSIQL